MFFSKKISKEEKAYFEKLYQSKIEDNKVFSKPEYEGYWKSIIDKYPESAHFVYELLQNADDAEASKAEIYLFEDHLLFKHNGKIRFSITDPDDNNITPGHINSITGIGYSTKKEDSGNKIGKFGVGFKAVFQYTHEPIIYDDKFSFRIINHIIPQLINSDHPMRKKGETLFVFPFFDNNTARKDILRRLNEMTSPILFLPHLENVSWTDYRTPNEVHVFTKSKEVIYKEGNMVCSRVQTLSNGIEANLYLFAKNITLQNLGNYQINIGYILDKEGRIDTQIRPKIHCFFPTSQNFDLCTICHAPFELVESRQQLKETSHINRKLIEELAELMSASLLVLRDISEGKKRKILNDNLFSIIPLDKSEYDYGYYDDDKDEIEITSLTPFYNHILKKLEKEKLIPTKGSGFAYARDVLYCTPHNLSVSIVDKTVIPYFSRKELLSANISESLSRNYTLRSYLGKCGIKSVSINDIIDIVNPQFMSTRPITWVEDFLRFVMHDATNLWKRDVYFHTQPPLLKKEFIKTKDGKYVSPYKQTGEVNVFFPLQASDSSCYNIVHDDLLKNEVCKEFLEKIGIKQPSSLDYIKTAILPKYSVQRQFTNEEINDDFYFIITYYRTSNFEKQKEIINSVSKELRLVDTNNYLRASSELHIKDASQHHLVSICPDAKFLKTEYYVKSINAYGLEEVMSLCLRLGVHRRITIAESIKESYTLYDFSEYVRNAIDVYSTRKYKIKDYIIPGLEEYFTNRKNEETNKYLWESLAEISSILRKYESLECYYFYRSSKMTRVTSTVIHLLKYTPWILDRCPSEVFQEEMLSAGYINSPELFDYFGIKKKRQSLREIGATDVQIENEEMGDFCRNNNITMDDLYRMAAEKANQVESINSSNEPQYTQREELENSSADEMFVDTDLDWREQRPNTSQKTKEQKLEELQKNIDKKVEEENQITTLQEIADNSEKYTMAWFSSLLDLEYRGFSEEQKKLQKGTKISFAKIMRDPYSERIIILSEPSHVIPLWLEEVGGIEVKFEFNDTDSISFGFEVASVKDFTLRLKVKTSDIDLIKSIDWNRCTKAQFNAVRPIELIGKLKTAFASLNFPDNVNLKEQLKNINKLSFIYGPPGTGKTTTLAKLIYNILSVEGCNRILVLAPTNKACDVIAEKILQDCPSASGWMGRFVNVADDTLEEYNIKIERESDFYKKDKCCLISTVARLSFDGFNTDHGFVALNDMQWDVVICDEASMIPIAQIVYVIFKFANSILYIAGDPHQIGPIVKEQRWQGENIYSMVELSSFQNPITKPKLFPIINLDTQYRSIPEIGEIFSNYSYNGMLKHHRRSKEKRIIEIKNLDFKSVNIITFPVNRFDSIFKPTKLDGSPVHVYSALLTTELCRYIGFNITSKSIEEPLHIGIICPYSAQSQLIQKLIDQFEGIPNNIKFEVGTVHSFQGDQCDIIMTVMNPPSVTNTNINSIFLNRKEIINVAVSRATDYLFVIMPHPDTEGFANLKELNILGKIMAEQNNSVASFTCDELEKRIFGRKFFIENSTFMTSHQLANVYTKALNRYEVRINDNSIDIQLGIHNSTEKPTSYQTVSVASSSTKEEPKDLNPHYLQTTQKKISSRKEDTRKFNDPEQYFALFERTNIELNESIKLLFSANTICAAYVLVLIFGNPKIYAKFNWRAPSESDIKSNKSLANKYNWSKQVYPLLFHAIRNQKIPIKHLGTTNICDMTYLEFKKHFSTLAEKTAKNTVEEVKSNPSNSTRVKQYIRVEEDTMYNKYEYGLSDW